MGAGGGGGGGGGCGMVVVDTAAAAAGLIRSLLLPRNPPGCWRRHLHLPRRGEPLLSLETESRISPLIRGDGVMSSQGNVAVCVPLCQVWGGDYTAPHAGDPFLQGRRANEMREQKQLPGIA
jgi:hypothetical protein